jgi:hypothetical protein
MESISVHHKKCLRLYTKSSLLWLMLWACALATHAAPLPQAPVEFQVAMDVSPQTVAQANASTATRQAMAIERAACGMEPVLVDTTRANQEAIASGKLDKKVRPEQIPRALMGKVMWLRTQGARNCVTDLWMPIEQWDRYRATSTLAFASAACRANMGSELARDDVTKLVRIVFTVTPDCMRSQIETAIGLIDPGRLGTSGLPCGLVNSIHEGDYDMFLKDLVRLYYLGASGRPTAATLALSKSTTDHIVNHLFTASGARESDSYSLVGCGNTEQDQGTAQERADEDNFWNDLGDTLGDIFKWLAIFLAIIIVAAVLLGLALALGGPILGSAVAAALVLGATVLPSLMFARIPETENHLFMINTSRYLINQVLISQLTDEDDISTMQDYQSEIREWLLKRMQRISKEDFREYNARPYTRFTQPSIMNLHDFAQNDNLRDAAKIVLEVTSAKFAVSSSQGRRFVPFRRLLQSNRDASIEPGNNITSNNFQLATGVGGADFQSELWTFYSGIVDHLPRVEVPANSILTPLSIPKSAAKVPLHLMSASIIEGWIYPATSRYRPQDATLSWVFGRPTYFQSVRHDGIEIYAGDSSHVLSAGGLRAKVSEEIDLPVNPTPGGLGVFAAFDGMGNCEDLGTGVPTMFIPAAGTLQMRPEQFVRFEGGIFWMPRNGTEKTRCRNAGDSDAEYKTRTPSITGEPSEVDVSKSENRRFDFGHDYNTCVHKGFACGTNLVIPDTYRTCSLGNQVASRVNAGGVWHFIDSKQCGLFSNTTDPRKSFFVAAYEVPCQAAGDSTPPALCRNWGLVEVRTDGETNPTVRAQHFDDFKRNAMANEANLNLTLLLRAGLPFGSSSWTIGQSRGPATYRKLDGTRIDFTINRNQNDRADWDIIAINGAPQGSIKSWQPLAGDVISTVSSGHYRLFGWGGVPAIDLDFSNAASPKFSPL